MNSFQNRKIERERERDHIRKTVSPVLKVHRQCPLVLLIEVMHMIGINFYITLEGLHYTEILMLPLGGLLKTKLRGF
jgi:hypothetical protein